MTDSPTRKKRFGAGICWEYMEKGACPCDIEKYPSGWHPNLSITTTTTAASPSGTAVVARMPKLIPEWNESLKYLGFIEGDPTNFAVLDTKYEEKEEVKVLGASYAPGMKKWIVVAGQDLGPFAKWHPRIYNRPVNEVVLYNSDIDVASTLGELKRCGLHPSHFEVGANDVEADNYLRPESSAVPQQQRNCAPGDAGRKEPSGGTAEKRRLDFHEGNAATLTGESGGESASISKRPRFATPESLQTFVRSKQHKQNEVAAQLQDKAPTATPKKHEEHNNELSNLLSIAKSALVRCNSAGGISNEQKQFNEAIYHVVEAISSRMSNEKNSPIDRLGRHSMAVTPTQQQAGLDGKAPHVPGSWYDLT